MNKKDRKLTSAEQKRKAHFERICEDMEQKGYLKKNLTVGVLKANIMAVIVMLPLVVVAFVAYLMINPIDSIEFFISFPEDIVFFAAFILLVILHEAIHGLTWGICTGSSCGGYGRFRTPSAICSYDDKWRRRFFHHF